MPSPPLIPTPPRASREPCTRDALYEALWTLLSPTEPPDASLLRYASDPLAFAADHLGVTLWEKQAQILQAFCDHPQVAVKSGHGVGKSFVAACGALWGVYCFRPSLVLTTAPSQRQVEKVLWKEIRLLHARAKGLTGLCLKTQLEVSLEQSAFGFTADSPEAAAGQHCENVRLILDEASGIPEAIYQALQGALTGESTGLLAIGNPTLPEGLLYDAFHGAAQVWERFSITCHDSPNFGVPAGQKLPYPGLVTPQWVERRRLEWGEESDAFRVRVLGEFPKAAPDTLIPLAWVEAAETGDVLTPEPDAPRVLALDPARYGQCESVAALRQGPTLMAMHAWQGLDSMDLVGQLVRLVRLHSPSLLIVDAIGMGGPILDRLTEISREGGLGECRVVPFNSAAKARDDEQFENRRAEAYWGLRQRYENGALHHQSTWPKLTGQLTSLKYRLTSRGRTLIQSKEDMLKLSKPSPDWADAVSMAFSESGTRARACAIGGTPRPTG
jgi:phage terminase large subunit